MTTVPLTVAVCTWNRAALLREGLACLTALDVPAGQAWEVVVVDNASTDATPDVIREFAGRLPLRAVREPVPGIASARNAAARAARGEHILWMDDDVRPPAGWLAVYAAAIRAHPGVDVFGGPILAWFEGRGLEAPAWIAAAAAAFPGVWGAYGAQDLGPEERPLEAGEYLWNGNLLVRTSWHRAVPYDPDLGRKHGSLLGGEEMVVLDVLRARGAAARWLPSARVHHVIPVPRQSRRYLRRHLEACGEMVAVQYFKRKGRLPPRRWELRLLMRTLRQEARYQVLRCIGSPARWIHPLVQSSLARGELRTYRLNR